MQLRVEAACRALREASPRLRERQRGNVRETGESVASRCCGSTSTRCARSRQPFEIGAEPVDGPELRLTGSGFAVRLSSSMPNPPKTAACWVAISTRHARRTDGRDAHGGAADLIGSVLQRSSVALCVVSQRCRTPLHARGSWPHMRHGHSIATAARYLSTRFTSRSVGSAIRDRSMLSRRSASFTARPTGLVAARLTKSI
jgi:hypothetical protein